MSLSNHSAQLGSSIVSAGAGLVGAGLSAWSQRQANQSNKDITQSQMDFAREMFDKTNRYNSPIAQMQRYRDAGLNPYYYMGQGAGSAVATTAPGALPQQPVDYNPAAAQVGNSIAQGISVLQYLDGKEQRDADLKKTNAETELLKIKGIGEQLGNSWIDRMNESHVKDILQRIDESKSRSRLNKEQYDWNVLSRGYMEQEYQQNSTLRGLTEKKMELEMMIQQKMLPLQLRKISSEISMISQGIEESKVRQKDYEESGQLKSAQRETEYQKKISQQLDNLLKNYSPEQRALIKQFSVGEHYIRSRQPGFMGSGLSIPNLIGAINFTDP